jgi:hypothetical protein
VDECTAYIVRWLFNRARASFAPTPTAAITAALARCPVSWSGMGRFPTQDTYQLHTAKNAKAATTSFTALATVSVMVPTNLAASKMPSADTS